ncbi:MAG: diguanylate cyclase [Actinomycetes bacterium]
MSLRTRLYLVLGALFLVPIIVGGLVLALVIPGIRSDQLDKELQFAGVAVSNEIVDECQVVSLAVRTVALESAASSPAQAVHSATAGRYVGYAALLAPDGTVVAQAGALPTGAGQPGQLAPCTRSTAAASFIAERTTVSGVPGVRTAVVARALDKPFLNRLADRTGAPSGDVLLLRGDRLVASSLPGDLAQKIATSMKGRQGVGSVGDWVAYATQPRAGSPYRVIVAAETPGTDRSVIVPFALILVAGAVVAGLLVTSVARSLSQPFADLTEVAERVAGGDLDARVDDLPEGEAGRLGDAFNRMTTELRRNMTALEQSREDLRDSLERIGDTLMSTHDLEGLLQVVLETAVVTLRAKAGVVLYGAPDQLRMIAEHRLHEAGLVAPSDVTPGAGVLGRVVASGESIRGRIGSGPSQLVPIASEPREGDILATPLRSMGAVTGVLALYGREDGRPFDATDDDALRTLSGQASTAIDNVQLHQEAQRLSTTDALTGLWNFRYLSMSLAREIERSTRFDRPLAVLMLDLDHFKQVNDTYGHARGDSVLRELAHRVQEQIREVDTFARYGGEEFVALLRGVAGRPAADRAEGLRHRCAEVLVDTPLGPVGVTASVGVAGFRPGDTAMALLKAADLALYAAKAAGRDRVELARRR